MRTTAVEHFDVLVIGAGLSGIGAGCHLREKLPHKTFAILEARNAIGGTWDLFRYPGIRSDSDMHTLGYAFAPWKDPRAIADGPSILSYVRETAARYGIADRVRFGHRVVAADWSEADARWTVEVDRGTGEPTTFSCAFLVTCCGYYDYADGYTPELPGREDFTGQVVHPQHWPEDLDYAGKRVVVIGSGATAITLVPAMARDAAHVTMLQRSPSYIISLPGVDPIAGHLRRWLPTRAAYGAIRAKNVGTQAVWYWFCKRFPKQARAVIRKGAAAQLPADFEVDTHLRPSYDPWTQRMCISPDGDLFEALREGSASIVTDRIARVTPGGIALESGAELEADVIVTATGLRMKPIGGIALSLDGEAVALPQTLAYRGSMLSGVPNFTFAVGYTNASWTLKADLTAEYVCRVLAHMDAHGYASCRPPADPPGITREPVIDLMSGYVRRGIDAFPDQGSRRPWKLHQNYAIDRYEFTRKPVDDGVLCFAPLPPAGPGGDRTPGALAGSDSGEPDPPRAAVPA